MKSFFPVLKRHRHNDVHQQMRGMMFLFPIELQPGISRFRPDLKRLLCLMVHGKPGIYKTDVPIPEY